MQADTSETCESPEALGRRRKAAPPPALYALGLLHKLSTGKMSLALQAVQETPDFHNFESSHDVCMLHHSMLSLAYRSLTNVEHTHIRVHVFQ